MSQRREARTPTPLALVILGIAKRLHQVTREGLGPWERAARWGIIPPDTPQFYDALMHRSRFFKNFVAKRRN